jgi:hypothetical protein
MRLFLWYNEGISTLREDGWFTQQHCIKLGVAIKLEKWISRNFIVRAALQANHQVVYPCGLVRIFRSS